MPLRRTRNSKQLSLTRQSGSGFTFGLENFLVDLPKLMLIQIVVQLMLLTDHSVGNVVPVVANGAEAAQNQ